MDNMNTVRIGCVRLLTNGILLLGVAIPLIGCSKEADNGQSADPSIVAMRVANSLEAVPRVPDEGASAAELRNQRANLRIRTGGPGSVVYQQDSTPMPC